MPFFVLQIFKKKKELLILFKISTKILNKLIFFNIHRTINKFILRYLHKFLINLFLKKV